jgi:hypothetical protein
MFSNRIRPLIESIIQIQRPKGAVTPEFDTPILRQQTSGEFVKEDKSTPTHWNGYNHYLIFATDQ